MPHISDHQTRPAWTKAVFLFVLLTLVSSAVYAIVEYLHAPAEPVPEIEHEKLKADYVLMLIQCILGIIVMFIPSFLERRLSIAIPGIMYVLFLVFLYAAIYLGEIRSFYYRVPRWDLVLHGFSGLMLGALSFSAIRLLNDSERVTFSLSPAFVALFAFTFAVSMGVVWEIYEFAVDGTLGLNMQKFALEDGTPLVGREALRDTMWDLIVDALGAIVMSVVGYISVRHRKGWTQRLMARRVVPRAGQG